MGLFEKAKAAMAEMGTSLLESAETAVSSGIGSSREQIRRVGIRAQLATLEEELKLAYEQIGRKVVQLAAESGTTPEGEVGALLAAVEPKLESKAELHAELEDLEKAVEEQRLKQEEAAYEREFDETRKHLDKALEMDIITAAEHADRLARARRKVANFPEIRRLRKQYHWKVITKAEMEARIRELQEPAPTE